jgi:hypothetical protein
MTSAGAAIESGTSGTRDSSEQRVVSAQRLRSTMNLA